ncbi:MAG: hypothetical protein HY060_10685 [Proteobacteria bacterium]|nr:hypothetical protein [Pseudomonadota bacterium]
MPFTRNNRHERIQRLAAFFAPKTMVDLGATPQVPAHRPAPSPLLARYQLARQLLATLSPLVLAETGHLERRGGDRSKADPDSLRAARLRRAAARVRARRAATGRPH